MTIKDVIRLSAIYLNKENVIKYLDGGDDNDALYAVNSLTVCANVVINEVATLYAHMTVREKVVPKNGRVYFSELTRTPLDIISVLNVDGEETSFAIADDYIKTYDGAEITYAYLPPNYGLTDKIGFSETEVPLRMLAYGVSAEYCLTERAFDESAVWRNRYNDALSATRLPTAVSIKARSFL